MSHQKYPQTAASNNLGETKKKARAHYSHRILDAKKERKRNEAFARQDKYEKLTHREQLASCIPGGSKRQRARIESLIAKAESLIAKAEAFCVPVSKILVKDIPLPETKKTKKSKTTNA